MHPYICTVSDNLALTIMSRFSVLIICLFFSATAFGQDTLPKFSAASVGGNRVIIGWVNNYPVVKQIGIQRSHDSAANFKTILSVADPNAKQNGYADKTAPNDHMFYRLFVVLDKGQFFFTASKRASIDSSRTNKEVIS